MPLLYLFCEVSVVSFTGSSEVGGLVSASATASVKRLTLELGGNAPFIVFRYIERTQ
jgi:succinate-semialdehyde dehydrogenase/glutarate-semialdehyde dehydrogenase